MRAQHFCNLLPNGQYRIEGGHWLLENHRDVIAANFAQSGIAGLCQVRAFKQNMPAGNTANIGG